MDIPRMGLSTEFPYRAHVEVDEFLQVGDTFRGRRTIVKVKTGWS
jgi:hypothetical protein